MLHLLTLPFRVAFALLVGVLLLPAAILAIPFLVLRLVLKVVLALVLLPLAVVVAVVGALAGALCGLSVPLVPLAVVGVCIWALTQRSQAATGARG